LDEEVSTSLLPITYPAESKFLSNSQSFAVVDILVVASLRREFST
jgi:hypothetical protein